MPAAGTTVKSDQRRQVVLEAAVACFSRKGFYGTTTQEIASRAGISQPYIYRLFDSKHELFASAVGHVSELMANALSSQVATSATSSATPAQRLHAARAAYAALIQDRDVLRFLMHANCAAQEPLVGDAVRRCYAKQVELVSQRLGDDDAVREWFAAGMLDNVAAVLELVEVDEPWARVLLGR
jgi:AcrR family transcriptional regulator